MLFDDLPGWTISILAWIYISYSKWRKFVVNLLTQLCNRRTTTKGVPWEGKSGSGNGLVLSIQGCSVDPSAWKCLTKTEAWVIHWTDSSELIPGSSLLWRLYTFLFGFYIPSYTAPHFILMPVLAETVNNSNFLEMYLQCCASFHIKMCSSTLSVIFHILSNKVNTLRASPQSLSWLAIISTSSVQVIALRGSTPKHEVSCRVWSCLKYKVSMKCNAIQCSTSCKLTRPKLWPIAPRVPDINILPNSKTSRFVPINYSAPYHQKLKFPSRMVKVCWVPPNHVSI